MEFSVTPRRGLWQKGEISMFSERKSDPGSARWAHNHMVRAAERQMYHSCGRHWQIDLLRLDPVSLRAFIDMLRDLDDQKRQEVRQAHLGSNYDHAED
jgi:hypothetical protein